MLRVLPFECVSFCLIIHIEGCNNKRVLLYGKAVYYGNYEQVIRVPTIEV